MTTEKDPEDQISLSDLTAFQLATWVASQELKSLRNFTRKRIQEILGEMRPKENDIKESEVIEIDFPIYDTVGYHQYLFRARATLTNGEQIMTPFNRSSYREALGDLVMLHPELFGVKILEETLPQEF